jgi:hypothetical protein
VVLYGYETWSLTLREEQRLRVFENRILRRIFGSNRHEVMAGWRKLHNGELHNMYSPPGIIRMIKSRRRRWAGHIGRMRKSRNACRILVGKQEGTRSVRKSRRRLVDNIKIDFRKIGWGGMDWIDLDQDTGHGNEPSG